MPDSSEPGFEPIVLRRADEDVRVIAEMLEVLQLEIQMRQVRGSAERFVSSVIPNGADGIADESAGGADHRRLGAGAVGP